MLSRYGLFASAVVGAIATDWIVPGEAWYDTEGKKIDAHGGGIVRRQDGFYWVGFCVSSEYHMMLTRRAMLAQNWDAHNALEFCSPHTDDVFIKCSPELEDLRLSGAI